MNIYEIDFMRSYPENPNKEPRIACWQIPAMNQWDACAKIGQIVDDEDTKIEIFMVRLVIKGDVE